MKKIEYDKHLKKLYTSTKKEPFIVDVPRMNYITFIGSGHPKEADFQEACNTLFTLAYIIKFKISRVDKEVDYKVNPLEVSWHLDKNETSIRFNWKAMIMQPNIINENDFIKALKIAKNNSKTISYDRVKFESLDFGKCVQCFHKGDYNAMNNTMYKMQNYAKEKNYPKFNLYTHDIYLNDSRKTKQDNLKTIMRITISK